MSDDNALDVLLNALPSDQAISLASQLSITRPGQSLTAFSTARPTQRPTERPTTSISSFTTSTSSITSIPSSTTQQSTTTSASTSQNLTAQSANASSSPSPAPAASVPSPKSAGAIVGIVIGSVAAVILVFVVAFWFLRRRRRKQWRQNDFAAASSGHRSSGQSLLGSMKSFGRKKPAVFPEVAWLYDPVRPSSRGQDRSARTSNESGPRMGANAPWSSRPSTSNERERGRPIAPSMAELPGSMAQQQHLTPGVFHPPDRSRSPSRIGGFSRPLGHPEAAARQEEEEDVEDTISPLLPPPARFSGHHSPRVPYHSPARSMDSNSSDRGFSPVGSPSREGHSRSRSYVVSPDGRTPATRMGRAF